MATLLAILLATTATLGASPQDPCFRNLGPGHVPALLATSQAGAPAELDVQAGCLILESRISPRAEFIPPASRPFLAGGSPLSFASRPPSLPELMAQRSFQLSHGGNLLSAPSPSPLRRTAP